MEKKKHLSIVIVCLSILLCSIVYLLMQRLSVDSKRAGSLLDLRNLDFVQIERVDHSIKNEKGNLIAITYYEKPVLTGESDVHAKISDYFKNECQAFFFGETRINFDGERKYTNFEEKVIKSNLELEEHHFYNTVDTEVAFCENDILSFVKKTYWAVGGVEPRYEFGVTFDMHTGELITIDQFIDLDINDFRKIIGDFASDRLKHWDYESKIDYLQETLWNMDYKDYEYYYDGAAVYILLHNVVFSNECYELRWDLKTGDVSDEYVNVK